MKVTWPRSNEYSELYESAEWQRDPLAPARGVVRGVLIGGAIWLMVLCAWIYQRYF